MNKYLQIILFGFLTWLIPFAISFAIFPLHTAQRAFFETIMAVTVTAVAVLFTIVYLRKTHAEFLREGTIIGIAWFIINLAIDLPLFMLDSPTQMSFPDYMMDIGLTYLIYPIVGAGMGYIRQEQRQ